MPFVPVTLADQLWGLCKPRSRRRPAISCLISISASRFSLQILPTLYGGPFDRRWGDDGYWLLMQVLRGQRNTPGHHHGFYQSTAVPNNDDEHARHNVTAAIKGMLHRSWLAIQDGFQPSASSFVGRATSGHPIRCHIPSSPMALKNSLSHLSGTATSHGGLPKLAR